MRIERLFLRMFAQFLQANGIWFCRVAIGEKQVELSPHEVFNEIDDFLKMAKKNG